LKTINSNVIFIIDVGSALVSIGTGLLAELLVYIGGFT
jgi:hypothetical protein